MNSFKFQESIAMLGQSIQDDECFNPQSPKCTSCLRLDLELGTCTALADHWFEGLVGGVTAWGMFACFLLPLLLVGRRSTTILYCALAPIVAGIISHVCQMTIPSKRPAGACLRNEYQCGMPSGHVLVAYATLAFIGLVVLRYLRETSTTLKSESIAIVEQSPVKTGLFLAFVLIQALMPFGRVFIKYHTIPQVAFGAISGVLIGMASFGFVRRKLAPKIGEWLEVNFGFDNDWVILLPTADSDITDSLIDEHNV